MRSDARPVFVLGSNRIPFVKSQTSYAEVERKDLLVAALDGLVDRFGLQGKLIGDTALGAVINSVRDFNLAREALLSTKLHPESPAYNVQRACGTGLETTWQIGLKLHAGAISVGIAGGVDTNSDVPLELSKRARDVLMALNRAKTLPDKAKSLLKMSLGARLRHRHDALPTVRRSTRARRLRTRHRAVYRPGGAPCARTLWTRAGVPLHAIPDRNSYVRRDGCSRAPLIGPASNLVTSSLRRLVALGRFCATTRH